MDPATLAALAQAAASIGGGYLSSMGQGKETKTQKTKRKLLDDLLASLKGGGSYGDLFKTDEAAFQKSFVDPAKAMFRNQIAPQIQQQYIAGGQQRGTGLDDQLLRAGVDLDQMLNQNYLTFQESGKNRMSDMLRSALGMGDGASPGLSGGERAGQAAGGYLSSDSFANSLDKYLNPGAKPSSQPVQSSIQRRGYSS